MINFDLKITGSRNVTPGSENMGITLSWESKKEVGSSQRQVHFNPTATSAAVCELGLTSNTEEEEKRLSLIRAQVISSYESETGGCLTGNGQTVWLRAMNQVVIPDLVSGWLTGGSFAIGKGQVEATDISSETLLER